MSCQHTMFHTFTHKEATIRFADSANSGAVPRAVRAVRDELAAYIQRHPEFVRCLHPVPVAPDAPEIVRRMAAAARAAGVGPMAAVAGTVAQMAAAAAIREGSREVIVDNGGDVYLASRHDCRVALYAGKNRVGDRLALLVTASSQPLAICSSSSRMGHSLSLGACDLATVISPDASLADAVATETCNRVRRPGDLEDALDFAVSVDGIHGCVLVVADRVGVRGRRLPELVRNADPEARIKIVRHPHSH